MIVAAIIGFCIVCIIVRSLVQPDPEKYRNSAYQKLTRAVLLWFVLVPLGFLFFVFLLVSYT